ncbi:YIF1-domain-containing protein [Patellaria atrata CBS 101060]|uniref:Protein YIF1 n=1 Tax=Patellaria atrata CBS 101060 TaxID=1346257 RepID=A0A9P4SDE4_9PEZI|nr:YIF1-domain-containing protein [Patellaria atrata CBS 101060]
MHRSAYNNPPPAHSPPLHHPVPQHVSTVPQLRSPPPPVPQSQQQSPNSYGYPQQGGGQQAGSGYAHAPFGGFMNDPTAQMGFQMGKTAVAAGQEYIDQNLNRYLNVSALKHYFNVSNSYVASKLFLVFFPWRHRPWSRQQRLSPNGQDGYFLPPREDINSPDMYIPVMAFVTYILLSTLLAGLRGAFHPELLGLTATTAFAVVIFEILGLKLGTYLLSISNESQLLDLVAYSGYKFVGIIVTLVVAETINAGQGTGGLVGWCIFLYAFNANAFFLLRSLKYVLLPDTSPNTASGASYTIARSQRNRRTQFLFFYSYIVQFAFMWILTRQEASPTVAGKAKAA